MISPTEIAALILSCLKLKPTFSETVALNEHSVTKKFQEWALFSLVVNEFEGLKWHSQWSGQDISHGLQL
jgi:hypothetical protein